MRTLTLTGRLSKLFGDSFEIDFSSTGEAIRALCYQIKGFEAALSEGAYRVVRVYPCHEQEMVVDDVALGLGKAIGVRIEPVLAGAKSGGLGKIILGVVLVGAAFVFSGGALGGTALSLLGANVTYGTVALFGAVMVVGGAAAMLSPDINQPAGDTVDENKSFFFEGPRNLVAQGHPVPLVYGRVHTGSVVVSTGIAAEELPL